MYEMKGALSGRAAPDRPVARLPRHRAPPAGTKRPREQPVSRPFPCPGVAPGWCPFPTVKVFLLPSRWSRKSLREFILSFLCPHLIHTLPGVTRKIQATVAACNRSIFPGDIRSFPARMVPPGFSVVCFSGPGGPERRYHPSPWNRDGDRRVRPGRAAGVEALLTRARAHPGRLGRRPKAPCPCHPLHSSPGFAPPPARAARTARIHIAPVNTIALCCATTYHGYMTTWQMPKRAGYLNPISQPGVALKTGAALIGGVVAV